MSTESPKNIIASVEARLKNISMQHGWNYDHMLTRYATERFLYRLSISPYRDQFVLKGGNLFVIWMQGNNARPTIDTDLLRFGDASTEELKRIFNELASIDEQSLDGMRYDATSLTIEPIREATQYGGTRLVLMGYLGRSRSRLQFDIAVGDVVTPAPELREFPTLLSGTPPKLRTYPMASVVAEKAQIMLSLGLLNSRMKDFYDIWVLSTQFEHDFSMLYEAMRHTFAHRGEDLPSRHAANFMNEFAISPLKQPQWKAFLRKNRSLNAPQELQDLMKQVSVFLLPLLMASDPNPARWAPEKGWQ